jgi:class 3 adenylate cyclase
LNERIIGVLGVINRTGRAEFTRVDRRLLAAIASQIDTAIFEGLQIQRLREAFGRRVGSKIMDRMLAMPEHDWLKGERVVVTALFSDIRGFTATAEEIDPELLVQMLSEHLSALTEIVITHEGTVDKFVGDCVMALYNAPERQPDHALRAVRTALEMMKAHRRLMKRWDELGWESAPIGIGIDTGEVIVGNFGSTQRLEYTAIGRHINLAARLCGPPTEIRFHQRGHVRSRSRPGECRTGAGSAAEGHHRGGTSLSSPGIEMNLCRSISCLSTTSRIPLTS